MPNTQCTECSQPMYAQEPMACGCYNWLCRNCGWQYTVLGPRCKPDDLMNAQRGAFSTLDEMLRQQQ